MAIHSWLSNLIMVNNANICRMPIPEFIPKTRRQRSLRLQKLLFPPLSFPPLPLKTRLPERVEIENDRISCCRNVQSFICSLKIVP
jgi:hypothetical protein